jgi:hypothetical protein
LARGRGGEISLHNVAVAVDRRAACTVAVACCMRNASRRPLRRAVWFVPLAHAVFEHACKAQRSRARGPFRKGWWYGRKAIRPGQKPWRPRGTV